MRKVTVRLSDEMAERIEALSKKYQLKDLEETLRFSSFYATPTTERMEEKKQKPRALTPSQGS